MSAKQWWEPIPAATACWRDCDPHQMNRTHDFWHPGQCLMQRSIEQRHACCLSTLYIANTLRTCEANVTYDIVWVEILWLLVDQTHFCNPSKSFQLPPHLHVAPLGECRPCTIHIPPFEPTQLPKFGTSPWGKTSWFNILHSPRVSIYFQTLWT